MINKKLFFKTVLFAIILIVAFPLYGQYNALVPQTYFEIDGNRAADLGGVDWDSGVTAPGTSPDGWTTTGVYYSHLDDDPCSAVNGDDVVAGGIEVDDGPLWPILENQNAPDKGDIDYIMLAAEKVDVGPGQIHDFVYAAFARCGGSGSMATILYFDDGDGLFPADTSGGPVDTDGGDFLFRFDFNPNSGNTVIEFYIRSAGVDGAWVESTYPAGAVDGAVERDPGNFGEVALNLTLLGILPETDCVVTTASGAVATIAGGDLNSQMKDIVAVTPLEVTNCGGLNVIKESEPDGVTTLATDIFHYFSDQVDGLFVHDATLDVTGVTGTTEPDGDTAEIDADIEVGDTDMWGNVISQPDYQLEEDVVPAGWQVWDCECVFEDIFTAGTPEVTVDIYIDGVYQNNMFLVPPSTYANNPLEPARCTITNKLLVDFGDLPESLGYPSLLANDGPNHRAGGSIYFGAVAGDPEDDGQPTATADGDDLDGTDDDDGWTPPANLVVQPGGTFATTINVTAPVGMAVYVKGWIDWDLSGTLDTDESASATTSGSGAVPLTFTVPADNPVFPDNVLKNVFARFRVSSDEVSITKAAVVSSNAAVLAGPTGSAPDGEVEDYLIPDVALPVELTYFTATATMTGVELKWGTESEIENLGFVLERKTEGSGWKEIASYKTNDALLGQGTISSATDYSYTDNLVEANTTYEYRLADVDYNGVVTYHSTRPVTVDLAPLSAKVTEFTVLPAYPNPFNPSTTIRYGLDTDTNITIEIYDISGTLISTLVNDEQSQGWHSVVWNGTDQRGKQVPAGMYLSRVSSGANVMTNKLMLLK